MAWTAPASGDPGSSVWRCDARRREQVGLRRSGGAELVEPREIALRAADRLGGNARELRDLETVAAVRGAVRGRVQEYDAVRMLDRVEVQVRAAVDFRRQRGQLEVVRREEREAAVLLGQLVRDRPREREPVERRRAAPDLVDQHEALRRRAMQDRGRFRHLDHERRSAAGEIVGGADARVDRVDRADPRARGRHERTAVGEERDHRRLPHVRRLAAHVRAGDDQEPPLGREVEVVRDELVDLALDDGVAAAADREAGVASNVGRTRFSASARSASVASTSSVASATAARCSAGIAGASVARSAS